MQNLKCGSSSRRIQNKARQRIGLLESIRGPLLDEVPLGGIVDLTKAKRTSPTAEIFEIHIRRQILLPAAPINLQSLQALMLKKVANSSGQLTPAALGRSSALTDRP